jgi:hemolysin activation/secretion protein
VTGVRRICTVGVLAWAVTSAGSAPPALAQVLPPSLFGSPLERVPQLTPGIPTAPPTLALPEAPAAAPPPGSENVFLTPSAVLVEGVTVFPEARIRALSAPLVGTRIAASQVFLLAQQIERLYRDDGYFLTVVFVPQQQVPSEQTPGPVRIRVVEGYIGAVTIEGDPGPARARIERILNRITESRPARISEVERQLLLADDIPGISLRTVLRRGASPGASDMVVQMERAPVDAVAAIDNRGSRFQGPQQAYGTIGYNTPTRLGDRLEMQFFSTLTREQNFGQAAYIVPLTDSGLKLRIYGGAGHSEPDLALRDIGYEGDIGVGGAQLLYPLIRTRDLNLNLRGNLDYYTSRTSVGRASPNTGKVLQGQSDTRTLRVGMDGDLRDSLNGINGANIRFHKGLDVFGPTDPNNPRNDRPGSEPLFFKTTGEISRLQGIWATELYSVNVLGVVAGQYSQDILPASERFYLGGDRLGRGYYNGQVAGDRALAASAELQFNFSMVNDLDRPETLIPIQLYGFYDVGWVRNLSPNDQPSNRIASFGVGARVDFSQFVSGEVEVTQRLERGVDGAEVRPLPLTELFGRLVVRY